MNDKTKQAVEDEEVLTVSEAADLLRVAPYTVGQLLREKKLKGFKIHSHWRVTRKAVDEFMADSGVRNTS